MADNNNNDENIEEKKEKTAAEMRKINKPLMEKKRRERINNCLNQLKMFLMDATKKDSSYYSKLEKADILEMTVKYLKSMQRQHLSVAMTTDPKVVHKYVAGYSQCANEVARYLAKMEGFNPDVKNRLANHLSNSLNKLQPPPVGSGPLQLQAQGQGLGLPLTQGQGSSQVVPQSSVGLQMAAAGCGSVVIAQPQPGGGVGGELPIGQLASAVMTSMAQSAAAAAAAGSSSAAGSSTVVSSTTPGFSQQQSQGQQQQQLQQATTPQALNPQQAQNLFGASAATALMAGNLNANPAQTQQSSAQAQAPGVPVLPVQLIPAKLPSGDLVFLMTNQSMPVTNVMTPMSIQIPGAGTSASGTPSSGSLLSPLPATQGTPPSAAVLGTPVSASTLSLQGLTPLSSSSTSNPTPSTSVAVVPPQIQDPKPSTSSSHTPGPESPPSFKPKPLFPPIFTFPQQEKPLDLGPSTSGLQVKEEKSPNYYGAKPKSSASSTVTSSSASSASAVAMDLTDKSRDRNTERDSRHPEPLPPQAHRAGHREGHREGHRDDRREGHREGHREAHHEAHREGHAAGHVGGALGANQMLPLPPGNLLNLQHDSMWRPW